MANNLFIAYDLDYPGQNYDAVRAAITSLGSWYQFQYSLFYVHTDYSTEDAHAIVWAAMDANDKLCVLEVERAIVSTYPSPDLDAINGVWFTQ